MDTIPNRRYYRNGRRADGSYPCLECPYADNKTCSSCIFAKWNVEGILAGFSPKEAYRQSHQCDVGASPLLQQINKTPTPLELGSPVNQVLPNFFFQAEDGIRYLTVTGVQTCALPI